MKRQMQKTLLQRMQTERACALIGPRQVGKTYLLQEIIKEQGGTYLSLDDPVVREEIGRDPYAYLANLYQPDRVLFIDEPAKMPPIFDALKMLIDQRGGTPAHIGIANSGNYLLMRKIKESLAGRVSLLTLLPLSFAEMGGYAGASGLLQLARAGAPALDTPQGVDFVKIERLRTQMLV